MISAVILTKNEGKNIKDCLQSLEWCDEIIVVDDYSEDETIEKIKNEKLKMKNDKIKFKIFERHLDDDFAGQRNYGLSKARGEWVFFIDADERVSKELANEIISHITYHISHINGFYLKRQDFFLGRQLKHGETSRTRFLRLAKKGCGRWEGKVHEIWKVQGKIGQLKNPLLHYHADLTKFLKSINYFSTLSAQVFYKRGKRTTLLEWLKPPAKFVQNYFLRLGFLDSTAGFVHAVLMSLHSFLVRAKLFMLWKKEGGWK